MVNSCRQNVKVTSEPRALERCLQGRAIQSMISQYLSQALDCEGFRHKEAKGDQ